MHTKLEVSLIKILILKNVEQVKLLEGYFRNDQYGWDDSTKSQKIKYQSLNTNEETAISLSVPEEIYHLIHEFKEKPKPGSGELNFNKKPDEKMTPEQERKLKEHQRELEKKLARQDERRQESLQGIRRNEFGKAILWGEAEYNYAQNDSYEKKLHDFLKFLDFKCRIVFPNVIINAAYAIYEEMIKNAKNNKEFALLSGIEQTHYLRLIPLMNDIISNFHLSFQDDYKVKYANKLKELNSLATELKGHRSTGEIIAGVILIFIGAVLTAAATITALVSAGTLSVPAAVAGYAGLSLFATGAAAIGCSTLTLAGASIGVGAALLVGTGLTVHGG